MVLVPLLKNELGIIILNKKFITAQSLLEDSFKMADKVYQDGFKPDYIIGIWRGGAPVGIAVQEYFDFKGINTDHIAVRTSAYHGVGQSKKNITVHGLHYIIENASHNNSLLIVDDVFDTGKSVDALIEQLKSQMRANYPTDVRVACPWYKPGNRQVAITPDYFIHQSEEWLVFPHEISGLTVDEIKQHKSDLAHLDFLFQK